MRTSLWRPILMVGFVVMSTVGATGVGAVAASGPAGASTPPQAQAIINAAERWVTSPVTPYCWDGGTTNGPSHGVGDTGSTPARQEHPAVRIQDNGIGSGLRLHGPDVYAIYQALGITLPHDSTQATAAVADGGQELTSISSLLPGDLVYFGGSFGDFVHVEIVASGSGSTSKIAMPTTTRMTGTMARTTSTGGWPSCRSPGSLPD